MARYFINSKTNRSNTGRWVNQFTSKEKLILNKIRTFIKGFEYE